MSVNHSHLWSFNSSLSVSSSKAQKPYIPLPRRGQVDATLAALKAAKAKAPSTPKKVKAPE